MTSPDPDEDPTLPQGLRSEPADPDGEQTTPTGRRAVSGAAPPGDGRAAPAGAGSGALLGQVIGGCRIDKLLGRGAMGAVYQARQLKLDRDVAVKVIRPEMIADARMLKRFEVEARTVGRFNSANVVMVHDVGFERGVHYLVMELIKGKNLRDHVKLLAGGRLPAGEALPLIRQAIKGLEEARRLGIVHRDIKPDNLMLTDQGVLKIADFGIAKPVQDDFSMTLTSELIGTPLYMSPEQCRGGAELDFRSDMYSLGATFYYLLTGEPPIRASSVYELIQTKTKQENLCLWKALPELDENHPLSRVVERMTALEPEDRYQSYEELSNDLVLVEQGATITVRPRTRSKQVEGAAAPPARKRARRWLPVAAPVLVAGAVAFWFAAGDRSAPLPTDDETAARAVARLAVLRQQLRDRGPSESLRDELAGLSLPADRSDERERLSRDVEQGLVVEGRVQRLVRPTELVLPFDDLERHLAAADAATAVEAGAGPELRAWAERTRAAARAENDLGGLARTSLRGAFATWQVARGQAGGDQKRLAELGTSLDRIETARRRIMDLLPREREALERALPGASLDAARQGLTAKQPRADDGNAATALAEIRGDFARLGPLDSLRERARDLQPARVELLDERAKLLDDLQVARTALELAEAARASSFPSSPQAPFDDVAEYYRRLDLALKPVSAAPRAPWVDELRARLRAEAELLPRVVGVCTQMLSEWRDRQQAGAPLDEQRRRLAQVQTAHVRARELFPDRLQELDEELPAAPLSTAAAEMQQAAAQAAWRDEAQQLARAIGGLGGVTAFRTGAGQLEERLADLRARMPAAGVERFESELQPSVAALERWRAAADAVAAAARAIGSGDLTAGQRALQAAPAGGEGRTELEALGEVVARCREAFGALDRELDLAKVAAALRAAQAAVRLLAGDVDDVDKRLRSWTLGVEALGRAASGMVPIPGGRTKQPAADVPGFFLSATECSRAEFARFLVDLRTAVAGGDTPEARFALVGARLAAAELTPDRLQALIEREVRPADQKPIDRITWHEAAAFAAFYDLTLPTPAEWALAAFGDGQVRRYPWGDDWSNEPRFRNPSNQTANDVTEGGLSWRSVGGPSLHHLGGNVAEWLASEPGSREAATAGGRFNLRSEREAKEQAAGRYELRLKADSLQGIGFRTALRPRQFPALVWPR